MDYYPKFGVMSPNVDRFLKVQRTQPFYLKIHINLLLEFSKNYSSVCARLKEAYNNTARGIWLFHYRQLKENFSIIAALKKLLSEFNLKILVQV